MRLTFLGTGTSIGVPAIGCACSVCTSTDSRNKRRRASLHVEHDGVHVVIDTPPDFREQVLTFGVPRVDALLITHCHADHIFGFDDIRRFNVVQGEEIPVYGSAETIRTMNTFFSYVHQTPRPGLSYPRVRFCVFAREFGVNGIRIEPLAVDHAGITTHGYRIEAGGVSAGYVPDCHRMADGVVDKLLGVDVMILDALRHKPHPTHLTVAESVDLLKRIGAGRSFITHMGHDLDHAETQSVLPQGIDVPHDGLSIDLLG